MSQGKSAITLMVKILDNDMPDLCVHTHTSNMNHDLEKTYF